MACPGWLEGAADKPCGSGKSRQRSSPCPALRPHGCSCEDPRCRVQAAQCPARPASDFPPPTLIDRPPKRWQALCDRLAARGIRHRRYRIHAGAHLLAGTLRRAARRRARGRGDRRAGAGHRSRPARRLLANQAVMKVFHAARQDIEIFVLRFGDVPRPLFDTQIAAMVAGFGDQVGYDALVAALTGGSIDKAHRFSDWSARPLSAAQIDLCRRRRHVSARRSTPGCARGWSRMAGSTGWREEMADLADPATYRADPETMWERLRPRSSNRRFLGMLRAAGRLARARGAAGEHPAPAPAARRDAAGDRRHRAGTPDAAVAGTRHQPWLRRGPHRRVAAGRDRGGEGAARGRRCPRRRAHATARGHHPRWCRC